MLCQFCLGRKRSSDQLLRMVLSATSEHWNVTPPQCQPLPWEGGKQRAAGEACTAESWSVPRLGADTPLAAHRVPHLSRISQHVPSLHISISQGWLL